MITIEQLMSLAMDYQGELREFRLTDDLQYLLPLINAAVRADAGISVNDFYKALTINEKEAFLALRKEIDLSGTISIVKMIQKTNISRPVWTALLQKMEKFGIAHVEGHGAKGTYISIAKEIDNDTCKYQRQISHET